jgi:ankyrin repeat protein
MFAMKLLLQLLSVCFVALFSATLFADEPGKKGLTEAEEIERQEELKLLAELTEPERKMYLAVKKSQLEFVEWSTKLSEADAASIIPLVKFVNENRATLRQEFMYALSGQLFQLKKIEDSIFWFYTAQYQGRLFLELLDQEKSPANGPEANGSAVLYRLLEQYLGTELNEYVADDFVKYEQTLSKVLAEGKVIPNFAKIFPEVHFIAQDQWAKSNEKIGQGLAKLIEHFKAETLKNLGKPKKPGSLGTPERALTDAISNKEVAIAKRLIEAGASPNAQNRDGDSVLHLAMIHDDQASYSALLAHGADLHLPDALGFIGIHCAAQSEHPFYLREALAHGGEADFPIQADVPIQGQYNAGKTPLFSAIERKRTESVRLLIAAGAHVNHQDADGDTPVLVAVRSSMYAEAQLLLERGADPKRANKAGDTILNSRWFDPQNPPSFDSELENKAYDSLYEYLLKKGHRPAPNSNTKKPRPSRFFAPIEP